MPLSATEHIVCLGASAGGLEALEAFFRAIPENNRSAFIVVVHLSPDFKSLMPELLARQTSIPVQSIVDGATLEPNNIYVLPPGKNLRLEGATMRMERQVRGHGHLNLPIDLFFTNLAEQAGEKAVAVILSGTGSDGSRGLRDIKEVGGVILVQDPNTAKFDGMPQSAIKTGLPDHVGDPVDLAERIGRITDPTAPVLIEDPHDPSLNDVLTRLQAQLRSDHNFYRRPMIARRVQRRMAICGIASIRGYCDLLDRDIEELEQLRQDLLIGVTGFFRDPHAFALLAEKAIPAILRSGEAHEPVRIWVAACSTGQEVYSLAIQMLEVMESIGMHRPLKIFATDVNERAIARASRGTYSLAEVADLPPAMAARYLEQSGADYLVSAQVRACVIFATHNLITDPPFTQMDLVSCRNMLIYLTPESQERAMASLHFALRPKRGILFLGSAELAGSIEHLVEPLDERSRIYRRVGGTRLPMVTHTSPDPMRRAPRRLAQDPPDLIRNATVGTMNALGRSSALVMERGTIIELLADPNGYFRLVPGRPSTQIGSLLPADLTTAITACIARLIADHAPAVGSLRGTGDDEVQIQVVPVSSERGERIFLVELSPTLPGRSGSVPYDRTAVQRIQQLEDEVRSTRENLQAMIEELQSTNEEMQSTNEEMLAANEELQSTNEELHSVNEELFTVNAEYQRKNQELITTTADLDNLLATTQIGSLFLDPELVVRRFTPGLGRVIKLVPHDIGRRITDFAHHLADDFVADIVTVAETGEALEREIRDTRGAWLSMRVTPFRSMLDVPSGVLVTFVEVTRLKNAEETARVVSLSLRDANAQLEQQADQLEEMFSIIAHDLRRPVLAIDGMGQLALTALEQDDTAAALTHLHAQQRSMRRMRRMLSGLSGVARHRRLEVEVTLVDLRPWFDAIVQQFMPTCAHRGIRFMYACDGRRIHVCRTAAEAALLNLIENAIFYGSSGENPRIDVTCRVVENSLHLVVSDNGQGIPVEQHGRVFELFRRLSDDVEGSGVGLVSARRLVQRAGGDLTLQSTSGEGARFEATLPIKRGHHVPNSILLVDDDALDAKSVRNALPDLRVTTARSLREAEELLLENEFALVLLDLSLPDGHGLEFLEVVRRSAPECVVIVLSGLPDGVDRNLLGQDVQAIIPKSAIATGVLATTVVAALADRTPKAPTETDES